MTSLLVIEHKDGRTFAVSAADFRKTYEEQGFKALRHEDGSPFEPPAKHAEKAADKPKDADTDKG